MSEKLTGKVLPGKVLILPKKAEEKTGSGLIIPEIAKESPLRGIVVKVGTPLKNRKTELIEGDEVIYGKHGSFEVPLFGEVYLLMDQTEILFVI